MHAAPRVLCDADGGGQRCVALGRAVVGDADAQRAVRAVIPARRDGDRAGRVVHQAGRHVAGEHAPDRPVMGRADDDGHGAQLLRGLLEATRGRTVDQAAARGGARGEPGDRRPELLLRRLADRRRVLRHGQPAGRLARQGVDERDRRAREAGERQREPDRGGVVLAQREADDDGARHGAS